MSFSLLLVSTWFEGIALAGSSDGTCPSGSMNATQYSSGRHTASACFPSLAANCSDPTPHCGTPEAAVRYQSQGDQSPHRRFGVSDN
jgi:hypothetical protein